MSKNSTRFLAMLAVLGGGALSCQAGSGAAVPAPVVDEARATAPAQETVVLAGGCFWGIQAVFQHVKGVIGAESVKIVYDPSKVTYGELLRIFFSVAHDPTELNRQGPDEGTQYRSVIFYNSDGQQRIAEAYIAQLDQAKVYSRKIVTQVVPLKAFYPAEGYHQNYAAIHPNNPYIVYNDAPKVANLRKEFPEIYAGK
jgi:peptide-methionine (S)-S-oxide reductase